jgi:proteic killer suppression protein
MEVEFADDSLRRLESDPGFDAGFGRDVVKAFRKRVQFIRAARDERDFHAMRSLNFEKLKGKREGQYSMRLNDQWRLILELVKRNDGKVVVIVEIADYH